MDSTKQIREIYGYFRESAGVVTDSRKIEKGCIFFALVGDRFDGNQFALQAIDKGAMMAVISDKSLANNDHCILVEDTLQTLQQLALHHRRQFDIPFLSITGSNGKTTTKELVASVLSKAYRTYATKGNLNNHIGVPLSILDIKDDAEIAIIEMGANHVGEIGFLCKIAEPDYGLITNIGKAHLEGFGGIKGVIKGKGELFRYLESNRGTAFVNLRQPYLKEMAEGVRQVIGYGGAGHQPYSVVLTETQPFLTLEWSYPHLGNLERLHIHSKLYGEYNFHNILTAIAVGWFFRVPPEQMKAAIEAYQPVNNRSQIVRKGSNVFYLDAYNANPDSMKGALYNFDAIKETHKIAILGDMKELGEDSPAEHRGVINILTGMVTSEYPVKKAILVGEEFGVFSKNETEKIIFYPDTGALKSWFDSQDFHHHHFLIKGSRSIGLERLLEE